MEPERFAPMTMEQMTPEQRRVAEGIVSGPRGGMRGPFKALLSSPELADRVQKVGEYIRFHSSIPPRLNELAILITARKWMAQFEWYAHHELAMKAGLDPAIAAQIRVGKRPEGMAEDETVVYEFCHELLSTGQVSDAKFAAAKAMFGERGIIDLIGALGYYGIVSLTLNVDRYPLPKGEEMPFQPL